ncbi:RnfABCDGE type electron transport complex subunit D [Thomasclavelia sp.]
MENLFNVSTAPHIRNSITTKNIMYDVIIALLPATFFGIYQFGIDALLVIVTAVITAILSEYLYQRLMKLPTTINDGSAIITGLLLALSLSSSMPLWMVALGSIFAIIVVKQLFGGLGQNFMNPALAARCFLLISFAGKMNSFVNIDATSSATPLAMIRNSQGINLFDMLIGNTSGTIGETSVIALLIGAGYLIYKKVISPKIPLAIFVSFSFIILIGGDFDLKYLFAQICGGGLVMGAFFMATDYVTSPITPNGKLVYGLITGILAAIFRLYGSTPEGMSFAIIISNLLVPLIEKITVPKIKNSGGKQK